MELVYRSKSPEGKACALVAAYVHRGKLLVTPVGPLGKTLTLDVVKKDPCFQCLVTEKDGQIVEAATVVDYLCRASEFSEALLGGKDASSLKVSVSQWLDFFFRKRCSVSTPEDLSLMNATLQKSVFLCGNNITAPDLVGLPSLHDAISKASAKELATYPNVVRWFNHLQHMPGICNAVYEMPLVDLPVTSPSEILSAASEATQSRESKEKAEQKPTARAEQKSAASGGEKGGAAKSGKQKQSPPAGEETQRPIEDPMRLEMRVGFVKEVWKHPDADGLYCEEVDFGPLGTRRIASGLVKYLPVEEFKHQKVVALFNLKPKALRGFESHGMLLCASSEGKEKCQLLKPPPDTPLGERVVVEGLDGEPDEVLSAKKGKDTFAAVQPVGLSENPSLRETHQPTKNVETTASPIGRRTFVVWLGDADSPHRQPVLRFLRRKYLLLAASVCAFGTEGRRLSSKRKG